MASVRWSEGALRKLVKMDETVRARILSKITWLQARVHETIPVKLHRELTSLYKLRTGDYRVIYSLCGDEITIETVGHRRDVYKK